MSPSCASEFSKSFSSSALGFRTTRRDAEETRGETSSGKSRRSVTRERKRTRASETCKRAVAREGAGGDARARRRGGPPRVSERRARPTFSPPRRRRCGEKHPEPFFNNPTASDLTHRGENNSPADEFREPHVTALCFRQRLVSREGRGRGGATHLQWSLWISESRPPMRGDLRVEEVEGARVSGGARRARGARGVVIPRRSGEKTRGTRFCARGGEREGARRRAPERGQRSYLPTALRSRPRPSSEKLGEYASTILSCGASVMGGRASGVESSRKRPTEKRASRSFDRVRGAPIASFEARPESYCPLKPKHSPLTVLSVPFGFGKSERSRNANFHGK